MKVQFNKLNPAEAERLFFLLEELGECQQAIGKILRHGYESVNPLAKDNETNRDALEKEIGDVSCAIQMLHNAKDIDEAVVYERAKIKHGSVKRWMHHQ